MPAVILAGGRATRMGGGDKCLITVAGRPLLDVILERLRGQAAPVAINANGDPARFARYRLAVVADDVAGQPGPLAGILAAMRWGAAEGHEAVLTVAGDTPFFPTDLASRLMAARRPDAPIAFAATADRAGGSVRHPTFAVWPTSLSGALEAALAAGTRKIVAFADEHGAATVTFEAVRGDPFFNINTPQDVAVAEGLLADGALS